MQLGKHIPEQLKQRIRAALPQKHEPFLKRVVMWTFLGAIAAFLAGLFIFTLAIVVLSIGLPDVRDFDKLAGIESTVIYDRDGGTLYTIHGEENRKYVPFDQISPLLRNATISIEDDEFYSHSGFDIPGITAGFLHEIFGIGRRRGGSTITQQLAKNAFLSSQRSYLRKLKELILAIRLERAYDKNKILELYLNRIPYGNNAYGAEMASKVYFGKSAKDLTLAESVILASLPQAPTYYSPYGPNAYSKLEREFDPALLKNNMPKTVLDLRTEDYTTGLIGKDIELSPADRIYVPGRTDLVLRRMTDLNFITEEERKATIAELQHTDFKKYGERFRAAHFIFYVRSLLEQQFGKDVVAQGGLHVYTTLDPKLQETAETLVSEQIKKDKDSRGVSSAALFSMDTKTGEILAMVGSPDYFDTAGHGSVNHVFAKRQPGSSFKPIVYAKAFLNRYAPATVIYDTPTNFGSNYIPQNFEGQFHGPMSIRKALGQSRNIPALKAYFMAGQQEEIVNLATKLGITTLDPKGNYGPPLAIGAGNVRLVDMVQAFSAFANNGIKRDFHTILKVVDREDTVLYERKPEDNKNEEVLDPQVAYLINSVLSDKSVYLGANLNVPGHTTAAKTGTSNKELSPVKILPGDLWTIGYSPSVITGVWAGNSDGSATKVNADGYTVAAPIWSKFMTAALKEKPDESFPVPPGIKWITVSKASGKLPSADTPKNEVISEVFASFSVPTESDDIYKQLEVNTEDNLLPNAYTPKDFVKKRLFMNHHDPISDFPRWAIGIRDWVKNVRSKNASYPDFPPTEESKMFTAETAKKQPTIQITYPSTFSTISDTSVRVTVSVNAPHGIDRVVFILDDRRTPNSIQKKAPYMGVIKFNKNTKEGKHIITAKVYDKLGYTAEAKIEIQYQKPAEPLPDAPPEDTTIPADETAPSP
ncbi:MAG: penicillin-binding protein [Patescibacteria group bacterium]